MDCVTQSIFGDISIQRSPVQIIKQEIFNGGPKWGTKATFLGHIYHIFLFIGIGSDMINTRINKEWRE